MTAQSAAWQAGHTFWPTRWLINFSALAASSTGRTLPPRHVSTITGKLIRSGVFRPERLELLRDELGASTPVEAAAAAEELSKLRAEWAKLEKRINRQTLEIEATDDREDPVARRATIRIRELSAEQALVETRIAEMESAPAPVVPEPAQVEALLLSLPDLSGALASYSAEELLDLFAAFDLQVSYDKRDHSAEVSVALIPELLEPLAEAVPPKERPANWAGQSSRSIAGAGFEPATSGL